MLVHGGFWRPGFDRMHLQPMAAALAEAGWSTLLPEYRRRPGRPDETVADAQAAVRTARALPEAADCGVVLVGHSAGGHLVLQAAAALGDEVTGVVALAPVADLVLAQDLALDGDAVRAFLGGDAHDRPDLDPARMPAPAARVAVVHGRDDGIVPPAGEPVLLPAAALGRADRGGRRPLRADRPPQPGVADGARGARARQPVISR